MYSISPATARVQQQYFHHLTLWSLTRHTCGLPATLVRVSLCACLCLCAWLCFIVSDVCIVMLFNQRMLHDSCRRYVCVCVFVCICSYVFVRVYMVVNAYGLMCRNMGMVRNDDISIYTSGKLRAIHFPHWFEAR